MTSRFKIGDSVHVTRKTNSFAMHDFPQSCNCKITNITNDEPRYKICYEPNQSAAWAFTSDLSPLIQMNGWTA